MTPLHIRARVNAVTDYLATLALDEARKSSQEARERINRQIGQYIRRMNERLACAMSYERTEMEHLICKCCGKDARWCGDGEKACGVEHCAHIHCDHCGMHYSLEMIDDSEYPETYERARELMLDAYNA